MSGIAHDLLSDPLLTVDCPGTGTAEMSLCQALAKIGAGVDLEFAYLRAHQFHGWYSSLVMIAALALHTAGETRLPGDEARWRELLLALTDGQHEPWCLVVVDATKPAFFQPPVNEGTVDALKATVTTPDALDVLITAKNHDLKARRVTNPRPEHWIYALVTLQTMQGFLGAGNYGISRMNGGFASRPAVAATPGLAWGKRFGRDVAVVLADRDRLVRLYNYKAEGGTALLWREKWDGTESISMSKLDPFYVEICRRVRLVNLNGSIIARTAPTKVPRVAAGNSKGNTGDPWTPLKKEGDNSSLTVSADGFSYKTMQQILFSKSFELGSAGEIRGTDPERLTFVASVLVRGQGKTEGYHERSIPVPPRGVRSFRDPDARDVLGARARKWVEKVADVRSRALHPAVCALLQGGPEKLDLTDERARVISRQLDDRVDPIFFDRLWGSLESNAHEADAKWSAEVIGFAETILDRATDSVPMPTARRYRAIAAAEAIFQGSVRKNFPEAFPTREEISNGADTNAVEP